MLNLESWLLEQLATLLNVSRHTLSPMAPFNELGVDSLVAVQLTGVVAEAMQVDVDPMLLYDYPTTERLAEYLARQYPASQRALQIATSLA